MASQADSAARHGPWSWPLADSMNIARAYPSSALKSIPAQLHLGPEPEFASWAAICDGMKWPPAGSRLLTSRFGASSRHFSLLQKRILSMKRHRDEHDLGERWSWTHDEFDLLRNRTDSGPNNDFRDAYASCGRARFEGLWKSGPPDGGP